MKYCAVSLRRLPCLIIAVSCFFAPAASSDLSEYFDQDVSSTQILPRTAADWIKLANEQWKAGKAELAIASYQEAIRLDPQYAQAYLGLSSLLNQTGKQELQIAVLETARQLIPASAEIACALMEALDLAQRYDDEINVGNAYLALQPKHAMVLATLGQAYLKLKQYNIAIPSLEEATGLDGGLPAALYNLAFAYRQVGRYEDAFNALRRILDGDMQFSMRDNAWSQMIAQLLHLGRIVDATEEVDKELRLNPDSAYALFARGDIRRAQGDFEDAIADLNQALTLPGPRGLKAQIYFSLGTAYFQISRLSDAIEMLNKSAELMPENEDYRDLQLSCQRLLAVAYGMSSRCEESMDAFEKAIKLNPDDMSLYNNLSNCLLRPGHWQDAEKALRYAIKLAPQRFEPKYNLSRILLLQKRFTEAESELRECLRLGGKTWEVYYTFGSLQLQRKNLKEAASMYAEAHRLRPSDALIMNALGYTLLELNEDLEEALDLAQRAVKIDPASAAFHDTLGWAYFKTGKYAEAERELVLASRKSPGTAAIFEHLGDLYEKQGRTADAISNWKNALSLADDKEMRSRLQEKLSAR
jgi:tetratricopeptide (TPR) repeat protein